MNVLYFLAITSIAAIVSAYPIKNAISGLEDFCKETQEDLKLITQNLQLQDFSKGDIDKMTPQALIQQMTSDVQAAKEILKGVMASIFDPYRAEEISIEKCSSLYVLELVNNLKRELHNVLAKIFDPTLSRTRWVAGKYRYSQQIIPSIERNERPATGLSSRRAGIVEEAINDIGRVLINEEKRDEEVQKMQQQITDTANKSTEW